MILTIASLYINQQNKLTAVSVRAVEYIIILIPLLSCFFVNCSEETLITYWMRLVGAAAQAGQAGSPEKLQLHFTQDHVFVSKTF